MIHYLRDGYYCDCKGNTPDKVGNVNFNIRVDTERNIGVCEDCGKEYEIEPRVSVCFRCGKRYKKYTWYIPSGCPHCNISFVD